jgi:3-hydroxyisobutyrate dehydrogenase
MTHSQTSTRTVAVLGAGGTMGFPIARNIARAGMPVRAWNRSRGKAEPLTADGAVVTDTPAEAAQGASIVLTMLADGDSVLQAMDAEDGALPVMARRDDPDHPIWLQMSTIGEEATQRCAGLANRHGLGFVDAPVLGTRQPAEQRQLVILESGPEEARPRIQPVFDAIGYRTIRAGRAGAGTRLKLVTNSWVLAVVEAGAETIALAEGTALTRRCSSRPSRAARWTFPTCGLRAGRSPNATSHQRSASRSRPRTRSWLPGRLGSTGWTCRCST